LLERTERTPLREALAEMIDSCESLLNTPLNSRTYAQRERVSAAIQNGRAALAPPAQEEEEWT
jgi:hypothetical protein